MESPISIYLISMNRFWSCLCPYDEAAFLSRVANHCWNIIHHRCISWIKISWVFIATCWMVTNCSSLEVVYGFLSVSMYKQTLTRWLESTWFFDIQNSKCLNWYFLSVVNSNKQCSSETLEGAEIWTSDLQAWCV
jgi:hypothetical protein